MIKQINKTLPVSNIFQLTPLQTQLFEEALNEYDEKVYQLKTEFGFDNTTTWNYTQHTGRIRLQNDRRPLFEADGQIIGIYSRGGRTWEWAWSNPYLEDTVVRDSLLVRAYGERKNLPLLTRGIVPLEREYYANYPAAIGLKISQSDGIFFGDAGEMLVFIMLKNIEQPAMEDVA